MSKTKTASVKDGRKADSLETTGKPTPRPTISRAEKMKISKVIHQAICAIDEVKLIPVSFEASV